MLVRRGQWRAAVRESVLRREVSSGRRTSPLGVARATAAAFYSAMPEWVRNLRDPGQAADERVNDAEIDAALRSFSPLSAEIRRTRTADYEARRTPRGIQLHLLTDGHMQHRTAGWYQTGRLFGIDYRYPLLDLGVVEAALLLPWWAWREAGWTRVAYRRAIADWVPDSVAWNTSKVEPAQFFPPTVIPVRRSSPPPKSPRLSDPRYVRAQQMINRSYSHVGASVSPDARVRTGPAPR